MHSINAEPTVAVRPKGLVIDDEPEPLLSSLEGWMESSLAHQYVPEFTVAQDSSAIDRLDELCDEADFVLLDSYFRDKPMGPFTEGVEVGMHLLDRFPDLTIFFYSAEPRQWLSASTGERRREIVDFLEQPSVFELDKGKVGEPRELMKFCGQMLFGAARRTHRRVQASRALQRLIEADRVYQERHSYRLENLDRRRKRQSLVSLEVLGQQLTVPTRILVNSGVTRSWCDLELRVIEYSGGQVLSYFTPQDNNEQRIASDVLDFLETQCHEDSD